MSLLKEVSMKTKNILMVLVLGFTVQSYGQTTDEVCQKVALTAVNTSQYQTEWNSAQIKFVNKMYACTKIPQDAFDEMFQDKWVITCDAQNEQNELKKSSQELIDLYKVIHTACVKHVTK